MTGGLTQLAVPSLELGEGPVWDAASQALYWIDVPAGLVYRMGAGGSVTSWPVGRAIGSVFPRTGGGLLAATADGLMSLDPASGETGLLAVIEPDRPGNRFNDGACDRAGRLYAGTMATDESPGQGALYRIDPDLTVTTLATGVGISNGIDWSPDQRLMYYVDSYAYRLDVFDYDPATGAVSDRRPVVAIGAGPVIPDGLTVDAEGMIWVAHWGGGVLVRYRPDGTTERTVELPHEHVTACAFGGPELDQLYITTAAGAGDAAGGLFLLEPGVTGLPSCPFGG